MDLLISEEIQHRQRSAEMITQAADYYGTIDEIGLKRLAYAVECCVVDDNGAITLPEQDKP